jgi:N-acetylglucosamine-6-sulfatase
VRLLFWAALVAALAVAAPAAGGGYETPPGGATPGATGGGGTGGGASGPGEPSGTDGGKRPNVVLIVTDDQTLASYAPDVMPHTTRLLEGTGTRFANAFVTTPLCCPSRASMLTGQYGHNNGVLRNDYGQLNEKGNTLPVWLQEAGYRTMHVGRYLNFYEAVTKPHEVAPGWDDWRSITGGSAYFDYTLEVDGEPVRYGNDDEDYVTRVINDRAAHMIESAAPRPEPFFLQVDHIAPHQASGKRTLGCKSSPIPDPRDTRRFRDRGLPVKPSFDETDTSDKPSFIRELPPLEEANVRRITRRWRCSLAALRAVDRGVRELYAALRGSGELSNTAVIFVSDNGYYFGEHRIPDKKHNPYEEGIRVPLIVRAPKALRGGAPRAPVINETVANIDIAPTILQLAGAQPCAGRGNCRTMDGRSLMPLLRGTGDWPAERDLVVELTREGTPSDVGGRACAYSGVRTPGPSGTGTLYVEHTSAVAASGNCEPVAEAELYDLGVDPYQLDNLARLDGDVPAPPVEQAPAERLAELRDCAGIRDRDLPPASGHYCE